MTESVDKSDKDTAAVPASSRQDSAPTGVRGLIPGSIGSGLRWVVENKGIVGLALSAYLILKVVVMARGNQETALAIVRSAGVTQVVLGGVVSGLPFLAALALGVSMYHVGRQLHRVSPSPPASRRDAFRRTAATKDRAGVAWGTAASVLVALAFTPWSVFISVVPFGLALGLFEARRIDDKDDRHERRKFSRVLFVGLCVVAGGTAMYGSFAGILYSGWTAHESLQGQVDGKEQTVIGYVIDDRGGWLTVIESGTRRVLMIDAKTVKDREFCHVKSRWEGANTSALQWLQLRVFGATFHTLPDCPKLVRSSSSDGSA